MLIALRDQSAQQGTSQRSARQRFPSRLFSAASEAWQAIAPLKIAAVVLLALLIAPIPAKAESWVRVAMSESTLEQQYVDADSIQVLEQEYGKPLHIRLKTYWGVLDQPDSFSMAITEYCCQQSKYRDVEVNGSAIQADWQSVDSDPLNKAAMEYGCRQASAS